MAKLTPVMLALLQKASPTGGGTFIEPGVYTFIVEKFFINNGFRGTCAIMELYVKEAAQASDSDKKPNRVGSRCSYVCNLSSTTSGPSAQGNVKAFVLALMDVPDNEEYGALLEELIADEQPARGLEIADTTFQGSIQGGANAGKSITKHKWSNVETSEAQQAANIALMKGSATAA